MLHTGETFLCHASKVVFDCLETRAIMEIMNGNICWCVKAKTQGLVLNHLDFLQVTIRRCDNANGGILKYGQNGRVIESQHDKWLWFCG